MKTLKLPMKWTQTDQLTKCGAWERTAGSGLILFRMAGGGSHAAAAADANTHVVFRRLGIVLLSLLRGRLTGGKGERRGAASDSRDRDGAVIVFPSL